MPPSSDGCFQERLIWVGDTALRINDLGVPGFSLACGGEELVEGIADASFEGPLVPAGLIA